MTDMQERAAQYHDNLAAEQDQWAHHYLHENRDSLGRRHPARASARHCRTEAEQHRKHAAAIRALPAAPAPKALVSRELRQARGWIWELLDTIDPDRNPNDQWTAQDVIDRIRALPPAEPAFTPGELSVISAALTTAPLKMTDEWRVACRKVADLIDGSGGLPSQASAVEDAAVALADDIPESLERGNQQERCVACGAEVPLSVFSGTRQPIQHGEGCSWVAYRAAKAAGGSDG